jgi:hypothetical protein
LDSRGNKSKEPGGRHMSSNSRLSSEHPRIILDKGFIQWQGSEAQELTKKHIAENLHVTMGKQGLHGLRLEYYNNFLSMTSRTRSIKKYILQSTFTLLM